MATMSSEPINFDAQRTELQSVLESRSFLRAPKLAGLLSYLCERLFAGESSQIKEYSIGVEVFNRGASFDQDSDSIVRVEANRLRKRLAEYYADEGAFHELQITIPVGQYVPTFKIAGPVPVEKVAVPAQESQPNAPPAEVSGGEVAAWFAASGSRAWWIGALFGVLVLGSGAAFLGHFRQPKPTAQTGQPQTQTMSPEFGLPVGEEVRILAGADRSYVDHAGKLWNADAFFTDGTAVKSVVQHIWRTQSPAFFRSSRQGHFRYDIPLSKGIYELRLHFAETVFGPESSETGGEGSRIMTVLANGKALLDGFDVVADAGASRTADVKVFPDISPAADGSLHLEFSGQDGKVAMLSAIEILPGVKGHMRPIRLLTRQTPYYSNDSQWWSPDNYFQGGQMTTYTSQVSGTDDPDLYESERWGNFTYAIPVAPGRYSVVLHFAARHGEGPATNAGKTKAAHIFNVFCNGKVLLQNFDPAKEARQGDVVLRRASGLEPNAQGKLLLSFVPVEGYANVTGIEVLPQ